MPAPSTKKSELLAPGTAQNKQQVLTRLLDQVESMIPEGFDDVSEAKLEELRDLAQKMGADLSDVFTDEMDDFLRDVELDDPAGGDLKVVYPDEIDRTEEEDLNLIEFDDEKDDPGTLKYPDYDDNDINY